MANTDQIKVGISQLKGLWDDLKPFTSAFDTTQESIDTAYRRASNAVSSPTNPFVSDDKVLRDLFIVA